MSSLTIKVIKRNFSKLSKSLNIELLKRGKKYSIYGGLY